MEKDVETIILGLGSKGLGFEGLGSSVDHYTLQDP